MLLKFEESLTEAEMSASTVVNYLADLRVFLRWGKREIGQHFSLTQVSPDQVRRYRFHLAQELNRAAATVNRHMMALRKFFALAKEMGDVAADPTSEIALVQENGQALSRPLSADETARLLAAAQHGSRAGLVRRDLAILQLLLRTGLKVSEIVALKKDDLEFEYPGVQLKVCREWSDSETKTRHLPLAGDVCKALHEYLKVRPQTSATEHFFLSQEGRPISQRTVQRIISDCAKAVGLEGVSAQSLRRTFALQLFSETQDLGLVSERLGHQTKAITEQYLAVHENNQNQK
ncbi:MAG: tyrosine-type recombinase/integrase [Anaerolineales bacterium]|nr:tyrosine-type recombinase/integrase [Anaerolineales bacterium]